MMAIAEVLHFRFTSVNQGSSYQWFYTFNLHLCEDTCSVYLCSILLVD